MATQTADEARCETNRAFINVQRMHDGGRTESAQGRADPNDRILTNPATLPLPQTGIALLFWCWGANSHCAGRARMHDSGRTESLHDAATQTTAKARMPYKMNAQSFKHGCLKSAALSRYARMHKDSHTEPLHDATAQMAVIAQMQRHKWLSMHRCGNPNG